MTQLTASSKRRIEEVGNPMNEGRETQDFKPEGWPSVIPRIVVPEAQELVEFIKLVFQATGDYHPIDQQC